MAILLVRHGDALPPRDRDSARALSVRGRGEARALAARMRAAGVMPEHIVSSDFVRAVQTAELIAHALGYEGVLDAEPILQPGGDADRSVELLRARGASSLVVAVTHEPIVREIAAELADAGSFRHFQTGEGVLFDASGYRVV